LGAKISFFIYHFLEPVLKGVIEAKKCENVSAADLRLFKQALNH